jgi:hypothetical protein
MALLVAGVCPADARGSGRRIALQIERPPANLTTGLRVRGSGSWLDSDTFRVTTIKRL